MTEQPKRNYRIHDPNTPETAADHLADLFVEVNRRRIDLLVQSMLDKQPARPGPPSGAEDHLPA